MKKLLFLIASLGIGVMLQAQVYDTVHVVTCGTLSTLLPKAEKDTIKNLCLIGNLNTRDFVTMRDSMPALTNLNLLKVTTNIDGIPAHAFYNGKPNVTLRKVLLPNTIHSIGNSAFAYCDSLGFINDIYADVIADSAFYGCTGLTGIDLFGNSIGRYSFAKCSNLASILLYANSSIKTHAFDGCTSLSYITNYDFKPAYLKITDSVFNGVDTSSCKLIFSNYFSSVSVYDTANVWKSFRLQSSMFLGNCVKPDPSLEISSSITDNTLLPGQSLVLTSSPIKNLFSEFQNDYEEIWYKGGDIGYSSLANKSIISGPIGIGYSQTQSSITVSYANNPGTYTIVIREKNDPLNTACWETSNVTIARAPGTETLSAATDTITLTSGVDNSATIAVSSDLYWSAKPLQSWLTVSYDSTTLTVTANATSTLVPRTAWVVLSADTLTDTVRVIQTAATYLSGSTNTAILPSGNDTTPIHTYQNATWTATVHEPWLTVEKDSTQLSFITSANPALQARYATVMVSNNGITDTILVTQSAADPTLTVSSTNVIFTDTASTMKIFIASNAPWTISNNNPNLLVIPNSGYGNDSVTVFVYNNSENGETWSDTFLVTSGVVSKTVMVTQIGFELSADTVYLAASAHNSASIKVTSNIEGWVTTSSQSWLTVSPSNSTGDATVTFTAQRNLTFAARTARGLINTWVAANETVVVIQAAGDSTLLVADNTATLTSVADTATIAIIANVSWQALSHESWLTVHADSATLLVTATANPAFSPRSALVRVWHNSIIDTIVVTQAGREIVLSVNKDSLSFTDSVSSAKVLVTANIAWNASTGADWFTISPDLGSGNDSIIIKAQANILDSARSATVIILPSDSVLQGATKQIITVTQAGTVKTFVAKVNNNDFTIYPNPATASFSINTQEPSQVQVYTMSGTLVLQTTVMGNEPIATNVLPAGLYVVKIITAADVVVRNLVVEGK